MWSGTLLTGCLYALEPGFLIDGCVLALAHSRAGFKGPQPLPRPPSHHPSLLLSPGDVTLLVLQSCWITSSGKPSLTSPRSCTGHWDAL